MIFPRLILIQLEKFHRTADKDRLLKAILSTSNTFSTDNNARIKNSTKNLIRNKQLKIRLFPYIVNKYVIMIILCIRIIVLPIIYSGFLLDTQTSQIYFVAHPTKHSNAKLIV